MDSRWARALGAAGAAGLVAGLGGPAHPVVWTQAAGLAAVVGLGGGLVGGLPARHQPVARAGMLAALLAALWAAEAAAVGIAMDTLPWLEPASFVPLALRGLAAAGRAQAALPLGAGLGVLVLAGRGGLPLAGALLGRAAAVVAAAGALGAMAEAAAAGDGEAAAAWGWGLPFTVFLPAVGAAIGARASAGAGAAWGRAGTGAAVVLLGLLQASSGRLLWEAQGRVLPAPAEAAALPARAGTAEPALAWDGPVPADLPAGRPGQGPGICPPGAPRDVAQARLGRALALAPTRRAGDLRARVEALAPTAVSRLSLVGRALPPGPPVIGAFFAAPALPFLLDAPPAPHHRVHIGPAGALEAAPAGPVAACAVSAHDDAPLPAFAAALLPLLTPGGPCAALHLLPAPWSGASPDPSRPVPVCTAPPAGP